jgi:transposase
MKLVRPTIESIIVDCPEPSQEHPQGMCLDKGYDYEEVRAILSEFGFTAHIRPRGEEAQAIKRQAGFKARRWMVERAHSWMNHFRRLLVRSREKTGELSGVSSFRLWLDRESSRWVIRIGTESKRDHETMKPRALVSSFVARRAYTFMPSSLLAPISRSSAQQTHDTRPRSGAWPLDGEWVYRQRHGYICSRQTGGVR